MVLFLVLETGKGLLIAAALVRSTKLLDLDEYVTGDLRFSLPLRSKCVPRAGFAKHSAMRLVFSGEEKFRSLRNYGENPIARF